MITPDLPVEPSWLDVPRRVRVEIRPATTAVFNGTATRMMTALPWNQ
jgi:hypothetical protein